MRLAIVGGREHPCGVVRDFVRRLPRGITVISGGAAGVDQAAAETARACGYDVIEIIPYQADNGGPKARNWKIASTCDRLVAFWDGFSPGTAHVIACAQALGKPVTIYGKVRDRLAPFPVNV